MRVYKTPITLTEEPKVFGGRMSLRQMGYAMLGLFSGLAAAGALRSFIGPWAYLVTLVTTAAGLALGFVKIRRYDLDLDFYLFLWLQHRMAPKQYPYGG